jgi:SAM-dependent methyltransferase
MASMKATGDSGDARRKRISEVAFDVRAQPLAGVERCNLCDSDDFILLARRDRYDFENQAMACRRCGLGFLNPRMTPQAYLQFYRQTYRKLVSAFAGREISAETLAPEQAAYGEKLADFLSPFMKDREARTLLDIGGSIGAVSEALAKRFGFAPTILDPAPLELEKARLSGFEAILGLLEELDGTERCFDAIIMCQTIDHSLDIIADLQRVRKLLAPAGLFYADIIDLRATYLREGRIEAAIKPDHPFYLTEPTARAFLARAGFRILRTEYAAHRIGFACCRAEPSLEELPPPSEVRLLFREIRELQSRVRI